jgi:hypothetical protein
MITNWNVDSIISELEKCYYATTDPRMDGFSTWRCKQDLYRVQFALEGMLNKCPTYAPEEQWLTEQQLERDKAQVWRTLNNKV